MVPEGSLLAELADSVADGIEVDWSKVESSAKTPAERELIAQFRLLARVRALQDVDGLGREPLPSPPLSSNTDPARQRSQDIVQCGCLWRRNNPKAARKSGQGAFFGGSE